MSHIDRAAEKEVRGGIESAAKPDVGVRTNTYKKNEETEGRERKRGGKEMKTDKRKVIPTFRVDENGGREVGGCVGRSGELLGTSSEE